MKKKLTLLIVLLSFTFGYSQNKELSELLSQSMINHSQNKEISQFLSASLVNSTLQLRINRLAISSKYFKEGDEFKIVSKFEINDIGQLINISVNAPLPEIEQNVVIELRNIKIPKEILDKTESAYTELKFALPIFFQVSKESEILKSIEKEKRRIEREKEKAAKKPVATANKIYNTTHP